MRYLGFDRPSFGFKTFGFSETADSDAEIKALFAGGNQGVFYKVSPERLWQDAARTVPVIANGDPVRVVDDLSGNNNHAITPSSLARPIYRTDGILHWLEADGVDDYFDSSLVPWNGSSFFQSSAVAITGGKQFLGIFRFLSEGGNPTAQNDSYLEEYTSNVAPYNRKAVVQRHPSLVVAYDNVGMPTRNTNLVSWNSNNTKSFKTQVIPTQLLPIDMGVKSLASGNATLSLFRGHMGDVMSGRMYGFIWVSDNVSDENRDKANNYLAKKAGLTL